MRSIHSRISVTFRSLAALIALLALFAYLDMLYLENRVHQGVVVANLEYTLMEMRRQEKNLFLYHDHGAGKEALTLATRASSLIITEQEIFKRLASQEKLGALRHTLDEYHRLVSHYLSANTASHSDEESIRVQGHAISEVAEGLVVRERTALAAAISTSHWVLAISIVLLALGVVALGRWLRRRVVTPLRRLPEDLRPIAEGRFHHLVSHSDEAEMVAFTQAFNRMLDELDSRRRRLLQSEKLAALGVLVAGVAHELNNPLSNISSSCQLLVEELDTAQREQQLEWATTIDSETERARAIVAALMEYGRRREAELVPVPLAELLHTTQLLLKGPIRKNSGTIELDIPAGLVVLGDPQRLQQVFINLLRNAVESGDGVRVRVAASPCSATMQPLPDGVEIVGEPDCHLHPSREATQIVIEDSGRGIPTEELPHVFEPFYSRREAGQGMGLGLYIVQEIMQEHDGCIAISSTPGEGTTIFLRLPCAGGEG
ncbi:MAG: ATP-binding protein [Chromatiales bacterium]|nr:ATP-binding protein [Chromatiales bacterium]